MEVNCVWEEGIAGSVPPNPVSAPTVAAELFAVVFPVQAFDK
jgi:hypothetical protein